MSDNQRFFRFMIKSTAAVVTYLVANIAIVSWLFGF